MAIQMVETLKSRIAATDATAIFRSSAVAAHLFLFKLLQNDIKIAVASYLQICRHIFFSLGEFDSLNR